MKDRMIIIRAEKPLIVSFTYTRSRLQTNRQKKNVAVIEIIVN